MEPLQHSTFEFSKCGSRLGVQECQGQYRVETLSKCIPTSVQNERSTNDRSVYLSFVSSCKKIHGVETKPVQHSDRCNATELVKSQVHLCVSTGLPHIKSIVESRPRPGRKNDTNNTGLANTSVVPISDKDVFRCPNFSTKTKEFTAKPNWGNSSINSEQVSNTSDLDNFRKRLSETGISESAARLISNTRRPGSASKYNSSWGKCAGWCSEEKIDPFRCNVKKILDYLAYLSENGFQYRTIGCHRSAISAFHEHIDRKPVGQHPQVCALMSGVINNRPPQPTIMDKINGNFFTQNLPLPPAAKL